MALVDPDSRRRAAICHSLAGATILVEPFESLRELPIAWKPTFPVFIYDDGETIAGLKRFMKDRDQWMPVIAYAETGSPGNVVKALKAGALNYVCWPFSLSAISELLEDVEPEARLAISEWTQVQDARRLVARLTRRERQVLDCMMGGMSSRIIADLFRISTRTVETHRATVLRKLGASRSFDAIAIGMKVRLHEDCPKLRSPARTSRPTELQTSTP